MRAIAAAGLVAGETKPATRRHHDHLAAPDPKPDAGAPEPACRRMQPCAMPAIRRSNDRVTAERCRHRQHRIRSIQARHGRPVYARSRCGKARFLTLTNFTGKPEHPSHRRGFRDLIACWALPESSVEQRSVRSTPCRVRRPRQARPYERPKRLRCRAAGRPDTGQLPLLRVWAACTRELKTSPHPGRQRFVRSCHSTLPTHQSPRGNTWTSFSIAGWRPTCWEAHG